MVEEIAALTLSAMSEMYLEVNYVCCPAWGICYHIHKAQHYINALNALKRNTVPGKGHNCPGALNK